MQRYRPGCIGQSRLQEIVDPLSGSGGITQPQQACAARARAAPASPYDSGAMNKTHRTQQPNDNEVRMSFHRMCERIVASLAAAAPPIVRALVPLLTLLAWHWLQR